MNTQERNTTVLAATFAVLGGGTLIALFVLQSDPGPLWLWALFAVAFVALEFSSVEVNDRLFVSGSIMVAFAAAVAFGRDSAVLAVALMAAVAVLHPDDLRQRRWRQPAVNFGQLVLSASIGVTVYLVFLPAGEVTRADLASVVGGAALAAAVYDWVNFRLVKFIVSRMYPDRVLRPWSKMIANHTALAVLGAFGGALGAAYVMVGPVILPIMLLSFIVAQVAFHSYSQLRVSHEDTIRGFVKAIEALDPYTRGHTERVAHFCLIAGRAIGLDPERLERLRWAALIHDVGKVAVPPTLLHKPGALDDVEFQQMLSHMRVVENLLARVDFLAPMVEICAEHHDLMEGRGDVSTEAKVLAAADAFDAMTSTRSYRSAITQATAFDQLRDRTEIYGSDVVEALIGAIDAGGEVYGSPDEESAATLERLVWERAIRA